MNTAIKKQIISELDNLPDIKGLSLLDYLHFLKNDTNEYYPNDDTIKAIKEIEQNAESLKAYASSDDLFEDLGIKG